MRLAWDESGKKLYETGTNKGVLYPQGSTGTYEKGVAWNGLISVSESPSGAEPTDLWADNIKYASIRSAETYGTTITAYTFPDEFYACDGSVELAEGVMIGQQERQSFGFCYRSEIGNDTPSQKDDSYKLHLVYGCTASPSEKAYQTINDSPEAIEFSWEVTATPVEIPDHKPSATLILDSRKIGTAGMKAIEDVLYGSESEEAKLPLPAEVVNIISQAKS